MEVLTKTFTETKQEKIRSFLQEHFYLPPRTLEDKVQQILTQEKNVKNEQNILITGETENISIYFFKNKRIAIFTPFQPIQENVLVNELSLKTEDGLENFVKLPMSSAIKERLDLPKIVLVNPYNTEKYSIPRLPLCICVPAAYLRKKQKGRVWVLDTQLDLNADGITEKISNIKPDIVGVSLPHGQTELATEILDNIYKLMDIGSFEGRVIIGNFIAASFPQYFLDKYPRILISKSEGENTLLELAEHVMGDRALSNVSGIYYRSTNGEEISTSPSPINMDELPLPALDTVEQLPSYRGVLTHEWSRGCFANCTFCPRHHKPDKLKVMSSEVVISQLKYFDTIMDKFNLSRHLYVADEQTIGNASYEETERLIDIAEGILDNDLELEFDIYSRAGQIYNPNKGTGWHVSRMKMLQKLKESGLQRIFIGAESGHPDQLERFSKGISPKQTIMAVRMLSSLGIGIRLGFIMFDPLMKNIEELVQNARFLERKDALLRSKSNKLPNIGYDKLFDNLSKKRYVQKNKEGESLCTRVSYMLAELEPLVGSKYIAMLREEQEGLLADGPDRSIGKFDANYIDRKIGLIAKYSRKWIQANFDVLYSIKGLRKTADSEEEELLYGWMKIHRMLSLNLVKSMIGIIYDSFQLESLELKIPTTLKNKLKELGSRIDNVGIDRVLDECLEIYLQLMENKVIKKTEKKLLKGEIIDTRDNRLRKALKRWKRQNN